MIENKLLSKNQVNYALITVKKYYFETFFFLACDTKVFANFLSV